MRAWINLFEKEYDPAFVNAVELWCDDYSQDHAYNGANNAFERHLIELAALHPVKIGGTLYRGQFIDDDLVLRLLNGETITIKPMKRLIFSWSHSAEIAYSFAETYAEDQNQSTIVLSLPASELRPIVDCSAITGDTYEREVICINQALSISLKDVVALWRFDETEYRSSNIFDRLYDQPTP